MKTKRKAKAAAIPFVALSTFTLTIMVFLLVAAGSASGKPTLVPSISSADNSEGMSSSSSIATNDKNNYGWFSKLGEWLTGIGDWIESTIGSAWNNLNTLSLDNQIVDVPTGFKIALLFHKIELHPEAETFFLEGGEKWWNLKQRIDGNDQNKTVKTEEEKAFHKEFMENLKKLSKPAQKSLFKALLQFEIEKAGTHSDAKKFLLNSAEMVIDMMLRRTGDISSWDQSKNTKTDEEVVAMAAEFTDQWKALPEHVQKSVVEFLRKWNKKHMLEEQQ